MQKPATQTVSNTFLSSMVLGKTFVSLRTAAASAATPVPNEQLFANHLAEHAVTLAMVPVSGERDTGA
jgi:hypothetical protein